MRSVRLVLILASPLIALGRDAVEFFVKHKKIKRASVEVLENDGNSSKYWIHYNYIFETEVETNRSNLLRVGIFDSGSKFDLIDCQVSFRNDNETVLKGYNMDVIKNIQETFGINVEFVLINDSSALLNGEVDLLVCYHYTDSLPTNVIELYPTVKTNLAFVYKPSRLKFTKDIFILTFAGSLWLVFLTVMILLALCLRISTTQYSKINPKYEPLTWVEITLWAIAAACQQGLSHTPSGFCSCLIFFLGYLMSYLLYTGFAATITSILVENVGIVEDLKNVQLHKLRLVSPESTRNYITELKERFFLTEYVNGLDGLFDKLNEDDRIGVGPEIYIRQYLVHHNQELFKMMTLNITYDKGFLILRGSPWRKIITEGIVAMHETGILQINLQRNLRPAATFELGAGYSSAGREHVGSAVLLFLGGVLFALVFLAAEFVYYLYKRGRSKN